MRTPLRRLETGLWNEGEHVLTRGQLDALRVCNRVVAFIISEREWMEAGRDASDLIDKKTGFPTIGSRTALAYITLPRTPLHRPTGSSPRCPRSAWRTCLFIHLCSAGMDGKA